MDHHDSDERPRGRAPTIPRPRSTESSCLQTTKSAATIAALVILIVSGLCVYVGVQRPDIAKQLLFGSEPAAHGVDASAFAQQPPAHNHPIRSPMYDESPAAALDSVLSHTANAHREPHRVQTAPSSPARAPSPPQASRRAISMSDARAEAQQRFNRDMRNQQAEFSQQRELAQNTRRREYSGVGPDGIRRTRVWLDDEDSTETQMTATIIMNWDLVADPDFAHQDFDTHLYTDIPDIDNPSQLCQISYYNLSHTCVALDRSRWAQLTPNVLLNHALNCGQEFEPTATPPPPPLTSPEPGNEIITITGSSGYFSHLVYSQFPYMKYDTASQVYVKITSSQWHFPSEFVELNVVSATTVYPDEQFAQFGDRLDIPYCPYFRFWHTFGLAFNGTAGTVTPTFLNYVMCSPNTPYPPLASRVTAYLPFENGDRNCDLCSSPSRASAAPRSRSGANHRFEPAGSNDYYDVQQGYDRYDRQDRASDRGARAGRPAW
eukprot:m.224425 g.224425  ORF g.224425 m.224425 type:complete len:491 (-) comp11091_c0_seq1:93-1565(-)